MSDTQNSESTENTPEQELVLLKERATTMGITFHPSIGVATLKAKIEEALAGKVVAAIPEATPGEPQTEYQRNKAYRDEALKLIRVIVNCMNPAKQVWEGEFFSVSNRAIGTVTKYVPYNLEAGYHIPYCIYEQLMERRCQIFYTYTDKRTGMKTRKGKLIKEFNVVVLPQLSEEELKELALQQSANNAID